VFLGIRQELGDFTTKQGKHKERNPEVRTIEVCTGKQESALV
jgi:hypothetical protein